MFPFDSDMTIEVQPTDGNLETGSGDNIYYSMIESDHNISEKQYVS